MKSESTRLGRSLFLAVVLASLTVIGTGCYSFTGASVPPHLKTIAVPLFDDQSGSGEPGFRERFTAKVVDRFNRDNSLQVAERTRADCVLEGTIVSITDAPAVITAGENVTKRRITVNVKATFQDLHLKKKVWDKQLSNYGDYVSTADIAQRQAAIDVALDKLAEDIVLDTVSGW